MLLLRIPHYSRNSSAANHTDDKKPSTSVILKCSAFYRSLSGLLTKAVFISLSQFHTRVILWNPGSYAFAQTRATGITEYLRNGWTVKKASQIAAHESTRTTQLYNQTEDELTLDEIERIMI